MGRTIRMPRIDLDGMFKLFGAVAIAIAVVLTVGVVLLTDPLGGLVVADPLAVGSVGFAVLLTLVLYGAYAVGRRH